MNIQSELGVWYNRIARYLDFNKFIPSLNSIYKSESTIYPNGKEYRITWR